MPLTALRRVSIILIAAAIGVGNFASADVPTFEIVHIDDSGPLGLEPVLTVTPTGTVWIAGGNSGTGISTLWSGNLTGFAAVSAPFEGFVDATVYRSSDGRLYYSAGNPGGGHTNFRVASKSEVGDWTASTLFQDGDRPWFTSYGTTTYLAITSSSGPSPPIGISWWKTTDGATWAQDSQITSDSAWVGGLPQAWSTTDFALPYGRSSPAYDWRVAKHTSDPNFPPWTNETVPTVSVTHQHLQSAIDANSVFYVGLANTVQYVARASGGSWKGPFNAGPPNGGAFFGTALVGGAAGKVDFAWYQRETNYWSLHYRQVLNAAQNPELGPDVTIANVVDVGHPIGGTGDFLTMSKLPDGSAVIAFTCWVDSGSTFQTPCLKDGNRHPMAAFQVSGPRI